jgi:hypothetical protein
MRQRGQTTTTAAQEQTEAKAETAMISDNFRSIYIPDNLPKSLVDKHGVTMARFPEWCKQYVALKNVPNHVLETKVTIVQQPSAALKATHEYTQLLRYLLKRNGALIRMYSTNGERSIDEYMQAHYHAIIVVDNTRIRMYYQFDQQRGHTRGWMTHYTYDATYDIWSLEDKDSATTTD